MEDERITVTDALLKLESAARDALVAYDPSFKDPAVAGEDEIKDAVRLAFVKTLAELEGCETAEMCNLLLACVLQDMLDGM